MTVQGVMERRKRGRSPVLFIVVACLVGVFSWGALTAISMAAHKDAAAYAKLPSLIKFLLDTPAVAFALALPSAGLAVLAMFVARRWVVLALSSVCLLIPFGAVLCAFLSLLRPLYQYQPI